MSFARVFAAQPYLLTGHIVSIEVDITKNTLHAFSLVGLPDKAVDEARDRVASALKNSNFVSPKSQNQKIVVSLSPADLKKEGSYYDVGIALAYLLSDGVISFDPAGKLFLGELALNGELLPVKGVISIVRTAKEEGFTDVFVPFQNAEEASLIDGITVYPVKTLLDVICHLVTDAEKNSGKPQRDLIIPRVLISPYVRKDKEIKERYFAVDFKDVRGQDTAKRGLEIAAAGGHNIALYGPPGTGKTMLARAFTALLPTLDQDTALEVTGIHSIVGSIGSDPMIVWPPFRSPHHTASYVAIVGGGTYPKPGEVTLAHRGVLFLDEFPEFDKRVVESLRQPLEDRVVSISRSKGTALFPAHFILVAAMNPCPCGYRTARTKTCKCKQSDIARYERKISGPIMDRIDMWVSVGEVEYDKLGTLSTGETSATIATRVETARAKQRDRFAGHAKKIQTNSDMSVKDIDTHIVLSDAARALLNQSAEKLALSGRAYHRVIKLARTIADLAGSETIESPHLLEALQYRPKSFS